VSLVVVAVLVLFVGACQDDQYRRREFQSTGNPVADTIIRAVMDGDDETVREYWRMNALPDCETAEAAPLQCRARTDEPANLLGLFRCGVGFVPLEEAEFSIPGDWDLFSVQRDRTRGELYRVVYSRRADPDSKAVVMEFRTAKPELAGPFPFAFLGYFEACRSAADWASDSDDEFVVFPP
jgi:hypothetical protein